MDSDAAAGPGADPTALEGTDAAAGSALGKGLRVLEALVEADAPVRISHLAATLGMQKSSLHRVLQTLVATGFAVQDARTALYAPSLKVWELGAAVVTRQPVKQAASTILQELHATTGETVSLSVRDGDDVVYLDKLLAPRPVGFTTRVGSRVPVPLTAAGRAMLSFETHPEAVVERVAARLGDGVLDVDRVLRDVERVRHDGYLVGRGRRRGVVGVAAAVPGTARRPAAGLTVSTASTSTREDAEVADSVVEALLVATARLEEALGRA